MAEVTATITWQGYFSGQSSMARESDGCGFTSKAAQWFLDPMVADHLVSRLHRCNLAWPTTLIARYPICLVQTGASWVGPECQKLHNLLLLSAFIVK